MPTPRLPALLALTGLALAAALPALARPAPPGAARVAPWTIDRAASRVTLHARVGGQPVQGVFKRWTAEVAPGGRVSLTVENASLVTGDPGRDRLLTGPGVLGAAAFKTSAFAGSATAPCAGRIAGDCPGGQAVAGALRLRDGRRAAVLHVTLVSSAKEQRIETTLPIDAALVSGPAAPGLDPGSLVIEARLAQRKP